MDLRRLRAGEWIAGLAGLVLLVSLFLAWYDGPAGSLTGWEALAVNDVLLALFALMAVALLLVTASQSLPAVPIAMAALLALVGMIALVLVLVRVGSVPGDADSREWGLWAALAGAAGINAGSWIAMRDERVSKPGSPTDLSGRPLAEQPEVEVVSPPDPRGATR